MNDQPSRDWSQASVADMLVWLDTANIGPNGEAIIRALAARVLVAGVAVRPEGTLQGVLRDALRQYGLTPGAAPWLESQIAARGYVIVSAARVAELLDALRGAEPRVEMLHQWLRATPGMGAAERATAEDLASIRAALKPHTPSPTGAPTAP